MCAYNSIILNMYVDLLEEMKLIVYVPIANSEIGNHAVHGKYGRWCPRRCVPIIQSY